MELQHSKTSPRRLVREHRPALVLLSPPCTPFSPTRRLTDFKRDPDVVDQELREGERHVDFSVSVALIQINAGRGFLFEHPRGAKSWKMRSLQKLKAHPQVYTVSLDMCQFELQNSKGDTVLKPTLLLTNIETLATALARRCDKQHKHVPLEGGQNTKLSAIYTDAFVDAILKGLRQHLRAQHFPVFDMKDSWELTPHELRCRHFCKRSTLASPEECMEYEVAKLRFTGQRRTSLWYQDGEPQLWTDNWQSCPSTPPTKASWSGITCFELQADFRLPQELQELAAWLAQGAAHDFYTYQDDEAAFQAKWMMICAQVFPSHRILGDEARERRADARAVSFADHEDDPFSEATGLPNSSTSTSTHLGDTSFASPDGPAMVDEPQPPQQPHEGDEARVRHELREIPMPGDVDNGDESETKAPIPPPEIRREIYRVHRNLGHPDSSTFDRLPTDRRTSCPGLCRSMSAWVWTCFSWAEEFSSTCCAGGPTSNWWR